MKIYKELSKIQKALKCNKGQKNTFGNYDYRSIEDILEGYKKVDSDSAIILSDEIVVIGDRFYVKATATLVLGDEKLSNTAYARESDSKKGMDVAQVTGSSSSYARKYALAGLFAIDDTKDADSHDNSQQPQARQQQKQPILKALQPIHAEIKKLTDKLSTADNDLYISLGVNPSWNKESCEGCLAYLKNLAK